MQVSYKIIVAYDGTDYHGWQIQPDAITVSQVLEDKFKYVFKKDIKIVGASRTDSGVHALGQVAKFNIDFSINSQNLIKAWNSVLPKNILIRAINLVNQDFHPQANVLEKTYYYNIAINKPLPFISRYIYWLKSSFNLEKLKSALNIFIGTHDFRSFTTGYDQESTIRTINSISVVYLKKLNIYQIQVKGPAFLRYMIRRIVGAALNIACSKNRKTEELKLALEAKNPHQHFLTAPAHGLILRKIIYKD